MIPLPEELTAEEQRIFSSLALPFCFRCNKEGKIFKYHDKENQLKFFMRCDYGCTLSMVGYSAEETAKKWKQATDSVIGWVEKQEAAYGQKKVHNGKGKNKNEQQ